MIKFTSTGQRRHSGEALLQTGYIKEKENSQKIKWPIRKFLKLESVLTEVGSRKKTGHIYRFFRGAVALIGFFYLHIVFKFFLSLFKQKRVFFVKFRDSQYNKQRWG
jgi:hypothetical protein